MKIKLDIIHNENCLTGLKKLPDCCIDTCVTSPPYFALREYHVEPSLWDDGWEGCLGLETDPNMFVGHLVEIFREVKRVLKPEGTCWVVMGDTYASGQGSCFNPGGNDKNFQKRQKDVEVVPLKRSNVSDLKTQGLPKDLIGIPWMLAFAMRNDGWCRSDIVWVKTSVLPESVTDRCTKSKEYIFMFAKSKTYYYDNRAIFEAAKYDGRKETVTKGSPKYADGFTPDSNAHTVHAKGHERWPHLTEDGVRGRNKRDCWICNPAQFKEAHFATYPVELIEPCIKAGCPKEVCKKCGKGRERIVKKVGEERMRGEGADVIDDQYGRVGATSVLKTGTQAIRETVGWTDCGCGAGFEPGVTLDPFMGSGTTAVACKMLGRHYVGFEMNPEFHKIAEQRIADHDLTNWMTDFVNKDK